MLQMLHNMQLYLHIHLQGGAQVWNLSSSTQLDSKQRDFIAGVMYSGGTSQFPTL